MNQTSIHYLERAPDGSPIPPTVASHRSLPVVVHAGWGDRTASADDLPVWTEPDAALIKAEASRGEIRYYHTVRPGERYETTDRPAWADDFATVVQDIRAAAAAAERERPDVQQACASWYAVLADIDRQYARHEAHWAASARGIAKRFRRSRVVLGEQTVPGKVCVRSTRGNLLGYANVWDGEWLGTVEVF
jgi:hypothetical protein